MTRTATVSPLAQPARPARGHDATSVRRVPPRRGPFRMRPSLVPVQRARSLSVGDGVDTATVEAVPRSDAAPGSGPAPRATRAIQRAFAGTFPPVASAGCVPGKAATTSDVIKYVEATDWRANTYLPQVDIASQADLQSYLRIWKGWGECVYAALDAAAPGVIPSNYRQRFDESYRTAVKTLFIRAEQGTGTPSAQLAVPANLDLVLPQVKQDVQRYIALDRVERLAPGANPEMILRMLNPGDWMGNYCSLNCPAAAEAVQDYLQTGRIRPDDCTPAKEAHRSGYTVSEDHWSPQFNSWPAAETRVKAATRNHGEFVMIEGDRVTPPAGLTQWHYFVVLNIKGSLFAVDGYTHAVSADIPGYVTSLGTKKYRVSTGRVNVEPVP